MNPVKNEDKLYDAFVSYSVKDEDFVQQVLVPQLEPNDNSASSGGSNPGHKLCLQHRDLPTSSSISDSFPGVAQLCAKHLLVVSRSYLETEWTAAKWWLVRLLRQHLFSMFFYRQNGNVRNDGY